jgi:chaperonin cofactor prefoldin
VEPEQHSPTAPQSIDVESVLRAAHALARSGHYAEAEGLLSSVGPTGGGIEAALLRAKMFAQQGDSEAARACWQRVLEEAPNCAEARAGIARLDSHGARTPFATFVRASIVMGAVAGLILLVAGGLAVIGGNFGGIIASKQAAELVSSATIAPVAELTREVAQSRTALQQIETAARDHRAALDEFRGVLDAHQESIAKLGDAISAIEASSTSSIQENRASLSALETQLTALRSDMEAAAARSVEIQSAAESRLGAIESGVKATRDATARQAKDIGQEFDDQFEALESAVTSLRRELDENRAAIEQLTAAMRAIESATHPDNPTATPAPKRSQRRR